MHCSVCFFVTHKSVDVTTQKKSLVDSKNTQSHQITVRGGEGFPLHLLPSDIRVISPKLTLPPVPDSPVYHYYYSHEWGSPFLHSQGLNFEKKNTST